MLTLALGYAAWHTFNTHEKHLKKWIDYNKYDYST